MGDVSAVRGEPGALVPPELMRASERTHWAHLPALWAWGQGARKGHRSTACLPQSPMGRQGVGVPSFGGAEAVWKGTGGQEHLQLRDARRSRKQTLIPVGPLQQGKLRGAKDLMSRRGALPGSQGEEQTGGSVGRGWAGLAIGGTGSAASMSSKSQLISCETKDRELQGLAWPGPS